jgi:uncharacterized delta-60 repeat protein
VVLIGRVCVVLTIAACVGASPAAAAPARPGTLERHLAAIPYGRTTGLAVSPDGRIVIVGTTYDPSSVRHWVRAYHPDGRPDLSFDSDGVKELADSQRAPVDVLIQPDGRIVVALSGANGILRLNPDGTPDAGFGQGGLRDLGIGSEVSDVTAHPDGRIVVAEVGAGRVFVQRHLPDGSPDVGFDVLSPVPEYSDATVAIQESGGGVIVTAAGSEPGQALIARLSPDGRLDRSFGAGGFAPIQLRRRDWSDNVWFSRAPGLTLTEDGHIRVPAAFRKTADDPYRMALLGLTASGHPDLGFGNRGLAVAPRRATRGARSAGAAISDSRAAIVVAGTPMRRFRADGTYDTSFAGPELTGQVAGLAFLETDTLVVSSSVFGGKYQVRGPTDLWTLHAGHDLKAPSLAVTVQGCRTIRVRARDPMGLKGLIVRADGRVVRRTQQARFVLRLRRGVRRVSVVATDFARNHATSRVRLPRC